MSLRSRTCYQGNRYILTHLLNHPVLPRYACSDQMQAMLDDRARYWTPVDQYVGGIEQPSCTYFMLDFPKVLRDMTCLIAMNL